jgi:uncharacterized protein YbbK (DUF523 family)
LPIALTGKIEGARMDDMMADREGQEHDLNLVSACLLGIACRFDGLATRGKVITICPEVAGGLPCPRLPAEIEEAFAGLDGHAVLDGRTRVVRSDGVDVTAQFVKGAQAALALAHRLGIRRAILKANSPSCGTGRIHEGRFNGKLVPGDGVSAALLKRSGIQAITEMDLSGGDT